MIEIGIAVLAGVSACCFGGGLLLAQRLRREQRDVRTRAMGGVVRERSAAGRKRFLSVVHRAGEAASPRGVSQRLREHLAAAGFHNPSAAELYLGSKTLLLVVGIVGIGLALVPLQIAVPLKLLMTALGAALLFFAPNLYLSARREGRRSQIYRHLPDVVDMLEICVSAGMGLDSAWNSVSDEIRRVSDTMSDEMELTNLEINLGTPRAVAMRHMAERTGVDDISSLVTLLLQSERFGASIVDALRTFARSLREIRSQRAEESAEKMAVKLLFPMVFFIFPVLFVVMVGPAVILMMQTLGSG